MDGNGPKLAGHHPGGNVRLRIIGGLYHELQVRTTYNSNHIEGSRLTEDQTRLIFETNTLNIGEGMPVDDVLETVHHFRAIDYVIDCACDVLSEGKDTHGDNSNIKGNESVTAIQNLQSLSLGKFHVGIMHKNPN